MDISGKIVKYYKKGNRFERKNWLLFILCLFFGNFSHNFFLTFWGKSLKNKQIKTWRNLVKFGSLTPEHLEITHKASNGLIFLSNFQFTIPRYS